MHHQTLRQCDHAFKYGGYFNETDGTDSTNTYGLIAKVDTSVCCLSRSVICGLSVMQLENTSDMTKSVQLFGLLSRLETETKDTPVEPMVIDGTNP